MLTDTFDLFDTISPVQHKNRVTPQTIAGVSLLLQGSFVSTIKSQGKEIERTTSIGDLVDVYRNLNKPEYFSCRQVKGINKNKVSGYANIIVLENPLIKISLASRDRVLREKRKNVHAFLRGIVSNIFKGTLTPNDNYIAITYNPYVAPTFFYRETGLPVLQGDLKRYAVFYGANVYLTDEL